MRVLRVGAHALLVECGDGLGGDASGAHRVTVEAFAAEALRRRAAGEFAAVDVVPGARTVLLNGVLGLGAGAAGDGGGGEAAVEALAAAIPTWDVPALAPTEGPLVDLRVRFDGPDLAHVAQAWGVAEGDVPGIICSAPLRAGFMGFAPGFAYLTGLGRSTPRRTAPRTSVPAGSLGLAGEYAGIYPRSSPGGWQLVGTYEGEPLWDVEREAPALLAPGTRVRIVVAS